MTDPVNPAHYRDGRGECIDAMGEHFERWLERHRPVVGIHGYMIVQWMRVGFAVGNAFKYRWRAGAKDGQPAGQDEAKAQWYDAFALHVLDPQHHADPRVAR